jgi:hypothetical protein
MFLLWIEAADVEAESLKSLLASFCGAGNGQPATPEHVPRFQLRRRDQGKQHQHQHQTDSLRPSLLTPHEWPFFGRGEEGVMRAIQCCMICGCVEGFTLLITSP